MDDKEKCTKQGKIDVWCLDWVKLTSRILRKLPHPNIEKKESCALHVPYGCRVGTKEHGLSKQACRVTCHCHDVHRMPQWPREMQQDSGRNLVSSIFLFGTD